MRKFEILLGSFVLLYGVTVVSCLGSTALHGALGTETFDCAWSRTLVHDIGGVFTEPGQSVAIMMQMHAFQHIVRDSANPARLRLA